MTEQSDGQEKNAAPEAEGVVEQVRSAHLIGVLNHSISTDGQAGMVVFLIGVGEDKPPEKFAFTFPATHARSLANLFFELSRAAAKVGTDQAPQVHFFNQYDIAFATPQPGFPPPTMPDGQGITAITFDRGTVHEYTIGFGNADGLKFAALIERDIKPRMTLHERELWQTLATEIKAGVGIIRPGHGFPGSFKLPPLPPGSS